MVPRAVNSVTSTWQVTWQPWWCRQWWQWCHCCLILDKCSEYPCLLLHTHPTNGTRPLLTAQWQSTASTFTSPLSNWVMPDANNAIQMNDNDNKWMTMNEQHQGTNRQQGQPTMTRRHQHLSPQMAMRALPTNSLPPPPLQICPRSLPIPPPSVPVLYPPRVNPYGIHGMGDGFHTFSMEWGMDSILF